MTVRRLFPLAALLLTAGVVFGQGSPKKDAPPKEPAKPAPGSLEDTLEKALRNSADIKAAEAKVRDAEAELNRVRQQVLTKATALHTDLNLARRMLEVAESALAATDRLLKTGAGNPEQVLAARAVVEKHRGEIEKLEVELKALRGEFALKHLPLVGAAAFDPEGRLVTMDGQVRLWDAVTGKALGEPLAHAQPKAAPAPPGSMADRVGKLLDKEVQLLLSGQNIGDAVRDLMGLASNPAIPVRDTLPVKQAVDSSVSGKLTVGAWLQVIEDSAPNVTIVVRDYGLLVTPKDRVPAGAIGVSELWNMKRAEAKAPEKK